jgi:PII-like signaling protein
MTEPTKLLMIFVNESDTWHDAPLYRAVVDRLRQLGIAGATAHTGILGFGYHRRVHHKGLFGIADDRPVTITVVDDENRLREVLPELQAMVNEGLILLMDATVFSPRAPRE